MDSLLEPIGGPLVENGIMNENSEFHLPLYIYQCVFIVCTSVYLIILCYKNPNNI
jgi:hypothetical protein